VLNYEEDVAAYTVKAATDPRVANRVIIYRPPGNIVSQLGLISSWEKKTGRTLKKIHVREEEIVKFSECKSSHLKLLFICFEPTYVDETMDKTTTKCIQHMDDYVGLVFDDKNIKKT
jgi:hypothetical protein